MADVPAVRWYAPFTSRYRFMRVSRATGEEVGALGGVRPGGCIERNIDSETYESGSLECADVPDIGSDLLRIWLVLEWEDGFSASVTLGTFLATTPSRDVRGSLSESSVGLSGRLQELADDSFDAPLSVPAGTNAVEYAATIVRGCGLEVVADASSYALSAPWTFGLDESVDGASGGSKLAAVNDLLAMAGFSAARTDAFGRVVMSRYVVPSKRSPAWSFEEGGGATFMRDAFEERDKSEVANVVIAAFETEDETVIGRAVDDDPASEFSTVSIGRRKVAKYGYTDLPEGADAAARQRAADAKAAELLATQQSVVHRVRLSHVYAPVSCEDCVSLSYGSAGIAGTFAVRRQSIELGAGCVVESELRSFAR